MHLNILAFAIPLFLLLMGVEFLVAKRKKLPYFNKNNSIVNISIGLAERLMELFTAGMFYYVYDYIQTHYGIFDIKGGVLWFIALLIFTDFLWYWYHRLAHEVSIFWAAHVVHHQSEDFNYTVSARITVLQAFIRTGFWAILPLIGFPAGMITSILLVHGIYPFFIHTRTIGKLGILEYVLVTPSHHRVHHANNEQYLDKNYGDMFIIWDKLFGTFQKEEEEAAYGLTKPLNSYSFLWQHFHFLAEMVVAFKRAKGFKNKVSIIFGKPDNIPAESRLRAEKFFKIFHKANGISKPLNTYVVWQIGIIAGLLFTFLLFEHYIPVHQQILFTALLLLTLINCGAIMEQRRWIFYLEFSRIAVVIISAICFYPSLWFTLTGLFGGLVLLYYFQRVEERYLRLVYEGSHKVA